MHQLWLIALLAGCGAGLTPLDTDDTAVAEAELLGLGLSPNGPVVRVGEQVSFTAKAFFADTTNEVVNASVSWAVTEPRVATIDPSGTATGLAPGVTDVVVTDPSGISAKVQLTVNASDAAPTGITLSPASLRLRVGDVVEVDAIASFPDGSAGNVSGTCTFTSDHPAVVAMTGAEARGVAVGDTTVRASCGGLQASAAARVDAAGGGTQLPDLRIAGAVVEARTGSVDVLVEIENVGTATATGFYVDLFLDRTSPPAVGASFDETLWVSGLGVGQRKIALGTLTGVSTGTHTVWALADADARVDETTETNNAGGPWQVTLAGTGSTAPQIQITTFDAYSDGWYTLYEVRIHNAGQQPANGFWVDLWYDTLATPSPCTDGDDFVWISALAPGATVIWEPEVDDGPYYWWDSVVFADSCLHIAESNENDNLVTHTVWPE